MPEADNKANDGAAGTAASSSTTVTNANQAPAAGNANAGPPAKQARKDIPIPKGLAPSKGTVRPGDCFPAAIE